MVIPSDVEQTGMLFTWKQSVWCCAREKSAREIIYSTGDIVSITIKFEEIFRIAVCYIRHAHIIKVRDGLKGKCLSHNSP